MQELLAFPSQKNGHYHVQVEFHWNPVGEVTIYYVVEKKSPGPWNLSQNFSKDHYGNWGLWEYDVVEAFLQIRNQPNEFRNSYLELQLSPLAQKFALVVLQPRQVTYTPLALSFSGSSELTGTGETSLWRAKLCAQSSLLVGKEIFGNFTACLGPAQAREYYALSWNKEVALDFHRPEAFVKGGP